MKLVKVQYEEVFGLEFTLDELYIINWALSDYMMLMQYCLLHDSEATTIIKEDQVFEKLSHGRAEEIKRNLDTTQAMKSIMELLVY